MSKGGRDANRRELILYLVIAAVLLTPVVYAATFDAVSESGAEFEATPSGPTIYFDEDRDIVSGSPFPASNTIHIQTSRGSAYYNGSAGTRVRVDTVNGTWSNISQADVSAGRLTINPHGSRDAGVEGGITEFKFAGEAEANDGAVDAIYSSTSTATIELSTNRSDDSLGLVDNDTENALDVNTSDANGDVVFTELDSGTYDTRVEEIGILTIREETEPHELITGASVEIRFFGEGGTVRERSDTNGDGKIDLTGLPLDESFVAQVNAPNHDQRTVILEDLSQQETIFLLNDSATPGPLEKEFIVEDQTGKFDGENTEILISRAINQSKYNAGAGFKFMNVAGDDVGADSAYITTLQEDTRYRIRVRNDEGDVRQLGAFTPETSGTTALDIGSITAKVEDQQDVRFRANLTSNGTKALVKYNDTTDQTDQLWIEIHERGNRSHKLLSNQTFFGPLGSVTISEPIPASENDTEWIVRVTADRGAGADDFDVQRPLTPRSDLLPGLPTWLTTVLSLGTIWVVAGLFSQVNGDVGALVVAALGAIFWFVGFAPGALGVGVVILSMVTAAMIFINARRDGGL